MSPKFVVGESYVSHTQQKKIRNWKKMVRLSAKMSGDVHYMLWRGTKFVFRFICSCCFRFGPFICFLEHSWVAALDGLFHKSKIIFSQVPWSRHIARRLHSGHRTYVNGRWHKPAFWHINLNIIVCVRTIALCANRKIQFGSPHRFIEIAPMLDKSSANILGKLKFYGKQIPDD